LLQWEAVNRSQSDPHCREDVVHATQKMILFLCTGNYYRSRFAEVLFNARAIEHGLDWRADSCGLALERGVHNVGPMSPAALQALADLGISHTGDARLPRSVTEADFHAAQHVVAVKEAEHRVLLAERFPTWVERVEYWHVHDLDAALPAEALAELERAVSQLVVRLRGS
jgi:protein-tyrosine phosphatase